MRKDAANDEENRIVLHADGIVWNGGMPCVSMGYFGANSNIGGARYWTLKVGTGSYYKTAVPVTIGQTALLALKIVFGPTNTISLYVNPGSLGGEEPAAADASASTTSGIAFKSLAFYGGSSTNQSSIDEIRFGGTYADVTPVQ